jgi:hypothetical protein
VQVKRWSIGHLILRAKAAATNKLFGRLRTPNASHVKREASGK